MMLMNIIMLKPQLCHISLSVLDLLVTILYRLYRSLTIGGMQVIHSAK